jgi:predicted nucleotidyltransferase component of viral defense system
MLQEKTVEPGTLALIKKLSADDLLKEFVLVGGTALSLRLGHRKSIDIDMFINKPFDAPAIERHFRNAYNGQNTATLGNAVRADIDGVKTELMAHQYPWIRPIEHTEGIRMASLEDIAAMKINAIVNSGSRTKDFVDVYRLLEQKNLSEIVSAYTEKYAGANPSIASNSLLYHESIAYKAELQLMNANLQWPDIAARLRQAVAEPNRIFAPKLHNRQQKKPDEERKQSQRRSRGRHL